MIYIKLHVTVRHLLKLRIEHFNRNQIQKFDHCVSAWEGKINSRSWFTERYMLTSYGQSIQNCGHIIIKSESDKFDPYSAKNFGPLDFLLKHYSKTLSH